MVKLFWGQLVGRDIIIFRILRKSKWQIMLIKFISNKSKIISFFSLQILKSLYPSPIEDPRKVQQLISTGLDMKSRCMDPKITERYFLVLKVAKICIMIDINFWFYSSFQFSSTFWKSLYLGPQVDLRKVWPLSVFLMDRKYTPKKSTKRHFIYVYSVKRRDSVFLTQPVYVL